MNKGQGTYLFSTCDGTEQGTWGQCTPLPVHTPTLEKVILPPTQ